MITTQIKTNLSVVQSNGRNEITADVSTALGGNDSGLTPHELLEASLGACTTITVMMYSKRKQWPVTDVVTTVNIVSEKGEINEIYREISFKGKFTEVHVSKLLEIANKCPMHIFLGKKSVITTKVV